MTDALALLADLRARGVRLEPDGADLIVRAPRGVLTPQLREALRQRKADLLAALTAAEEREPVAPPREATSPRSPGVPCPACGAMPGELAAVRARRELNASWDTWAAHARTCRAGCIPHRTERCPEGERLTDEYFSRWAAWLSATGEQGSHHRAP